VIKPVAIGGAARALRLANEAREQGKSVVFSHAFDGPFSRAFNAELTLAVDNALAAGIGEHDLLRDWPSVRTASIDLSRSGLATRLVPHSAAGLGVTVMR
ncbi:MAG: hypothetical protein R3A47_06635, partial [Polyangiales bacterium]